MLATPLLLLTHLAVPPQGPPEVLATYVLEGRPAAVTRTDVALEMAFHLRRRERGTQAIEQLIATSLTRSAATAKGLMPAEADVRAYWRALQDQLRAAGRRPEDFPAVRNTGEAEFLDYVAVQMAQERVVRAELGLGAKDPVNSDMMSLWLDEERKKAAIVSDPDLLPAGTAVRVGTTEVPLIDLGLLLLRTAEDEERDQFVTQVVRLCTIEAAARAAGVQVTPSDLDAAVEKRRAEAARSPEYRGITFENLLKAQGLSIAALRDLRVFRAKILLDKLARARFPDAALAAELAQDRQAVLDQVGPRRRIGLIFVRASDQPNGLIPRTFDEARQQLAEARARLAKDQWADVARITSEHNTTKMRGGDSGWHHRRSESLPEPMLAAAFALPVGEVSMPLTTDEGAFLVKALDVEPEPNDAQLLAALLEAKTRAWDRQLLVDAKVEFAGASPAAGKPAGSR